MSQVAWTPTVYVPLSELIANAGRMLTSAATATEILEASEMAGMAVDIAKRQSRMARAKGAHDEVISITYRSQAAALEIQAAAKIRIADEYDAAQKRGEVRSDGQRGKAAKAAYAGNSSVATAADIGLSRKEIYEARMIRDAEVITPGVVRGALDRAIEGGREPTNAAIMRSVKQTKTPKGPEPEKNADRSERMLFNGKIWSDLRVALQNLSGLPLPSDVLLIVLNGAGKDKIVSDKLPTSLRWLKEFSEVWDNYNEVNTKKQRNDDDKAD